MSNDCEQQKKEIADMKRMVDQLKQENERKSRECKEALNSLRELQNELMRKSMHVGSLGMYMPLLLLKSFIASVKTFQYFFISSLCCGGTSQRKEQMVLFTKRFNKKTEGTISNLRYYQKLETLTPHITEFGFIDYENGAN